jgi:cephalosporin-C deacetylase
MYLKPADFNEFWQKALYPLKTKDLALKLERQVQEDFVFVQNFSFKGFDDFELQGSIYRPTIKKSKYPVIVHYHGYGWHRGTPTDFKSFLDAGFAIMTYDFRHQSKFSEHKDDLKIFENIEQQEKSSFLKLYVDALRVLDVVQKISDFDTRKICLHGVSQGGGIALAIAALDRRPKLVLADVPSMSDFSCRINSKSGIFGHVHQLIEQKQLEKEQVLDSMAYFDLINFAEQISAEVLISVGSNDPVCPLECFLKTYQRINAPKKLFTYKTNTHEGGGLEHLKVKLERLMYF